MTRRVLAHEVIVNGETYRLHSVRIDSEGKLVVEPFNGETSGTVFVEGRIEVSVDADSQQLVWHNVD